MTLWNSPIQQMNDLFEFMRQTSLGRELWENFIQFSLTNEIRFQEFPNDLKQKLKSISVPQTPLAAVFITDGRIGTILYDGEACFGVLLPLIVHEMVHSLDESLWKAGCMGFSSAEHRREVLLSAECRAYDVQYHFLEEMKQAFPGYAQFLKEKCPGFESFHRKLLAGEIAQLYRLAS